MEKDESLDQTISDMRDIDILYRSYAITSLQIMLSPLLKIIDRIENRPKTNKWMSMLGEYSEYRTIEKAFLREIIDMTQSYVKYHMMPTTLIIKDDKIA